MAGFAVSLEYLDRIPNATMPYKAGLEEDGFLRSIGLKMSEIEPKANNCTEVLVWHTQTKKEKPAEIHIYNRIVSTNDTSLGSLLRSLQGMGVSSMSPTSGKCAICNILFRLDFLKDSEYLKNFFLPFLISYRCKSDGC